MKTTNDKISLIKAEGYEIDFGTVFNVAFDIYKKIALTAGLAILLLCGLFAAIGVGIFMVIFGVSSLAGQFPQLRPENLSITGLVVYLLTIILFSGLVSPYMAGLLRMAQAAAKGSYFSIGNAFDYYRNPYFKELFIAGVLISLFSGTLSVGLQTVGFQIFGASMSILISLFTFLTVPLIIFGNLKATEAIQGSILIVSKQFFILLGLLIVGGFFIMLGLIGFCIGIFFTMPFIYALHYAIYDSVLGDLDMDDEQHTTIDNSAANATNELED